MTPTGYRSKHVPTPKFYSHRHRRWSVAVHVLYGGGILYFQRNINMSQVSKPAISRKLSQKIAARTDAAALTLRCDWD
jgi:hypothetical protein